MKNTEPILTLALDCDLAIALVKLCLREKGFYAQHNFELDSACASFSDPLCPHRPDQLCNCQLITLQVYRSNLPVIPIIFHGHDERTELFYTEEDPIPPDVLFAIQQAKMDKQEFNQQQ